MTTTAVFRHAAEPVSAKALAKAFEASRELTAHDAQRSARRAGGVVALGLEASEAKTIVQALRGVGVSAEAVDGSWLGLPRPRSCRRADLEADTFVAYDSHGAPVPVRWSEVAALAVGAVPTIERVKVKDAYATDEGVVDAEYELQTSDRVLLDIVTSEPLRRFRIESTKFNYGCLGGSRRDNSRDNFVALLHYIIAHATDPALSRGAEKLVHDPKRTVRYETERELEHELAWLLWRFRGPGRRIDGETPLRDKPFVPANENEARSFTERARVAAAERVMGDNVARHERHMEASLTTDRALSAIAGLLTTAFLLWEFEVDVEGITRLAVLGIGTAVAGIAWWGSIRAYRSRRFWTG